MPLVIIKTEPLPTLKAAEDRRDQILRAYHPAGYGTRVEIEPTADGFRVVGDRWSSAD